MPLPFWHMTGEHVHAGLVTGRAQSSLNATPKPSGRRRRRCRRSRANQQGARYRLRSDPTPRRRLVPGQGEDAIRNGRRRDGSFFSSRRRRVCVRQRSQRPSNTCICRRLDLAVQGLPADAGMGGMAGLPGPLRHLSTRGGGPGGSQLGSWHRLEACVVRWPRASPGQGKHGQARPVTPHRPCHDISVVCVLDGVPSQSWLPPPRARELSAFGREGTAAYDSRPLGWLAWSGHAPAVEPVKTPAAARPPKQHPEGSGWLHIPGWLTLGR